MFVQQTFSGDDALEWSASAEWGEVRSQLGIDFGGPGTHQALHSHNIRGDLLLSG